MNMTSEEKAAWLAALRSGQYKQTDNVLYRSHNNSYCCMGVYGDAVMHLPLGDMDDITYLRKLAVLQHEGEQPFTDDEEGLLSTLNDSLHWDFSTIAAFVEAGGLEMYHLVGGTLRERTEA